VDPIAAQLERQALTRWGARALAFAAILTGCARSESGPDSAASKDAMASLDSSAFPAPTGPEQATDPLPSMLPIYRLPLSVHVGRSALLGESLQRVLAELNAIWLDQAGICFEMKVTAADEPSETGFDLYFSGSPIPNAEGVNGIYRGVQDIWSLDNPSLDWAPNPVRFPAARTAAHELGHGLRLAHQNCGDACPCEAPASIACDDLLMRSGRLGFALTRSEVEKARRSAAERSTADTTPRSCGAAAGLELL
jgi:hypothetical protein